MKNGKIVGPLRVAPELVKAAKEVGFDMFIDPLNQIKIEGGVIPGGWELSNIVNY